jgi:hypothetical protein
MLVHGTIVILMTVAPTPQKNLMTRMSVQLINATLLLVLMLSKSIVTMEIIVLLMIVALPLAVLMKPEIAMTAMNVQKILVTLTLDV